MRFGSDNQAGASARVLAAVAAANDGTAPSYGGDDWTRRATTALGELFGREVAAWFVPTGTAANSLALSCLVEPWQAVLCHADAHLVCDEATAPEFFTGGARLVGLAPGTGRLAAGDLAAHLALQSDNVPHAARAAALSIAQVNENGLVYTPAEVAALAAVARRHGLGLHVDGARFANAVAALGCTPAEITWQAGVDALSLGATKNGCLMAEVVVFFDPARAAGFEYRRKRAGHLVSKNRFLAAQLLAWLEDGHWLELARHANGCAARLAAGLAALPGVRFPWPVQANELFPVLPAAMAARLRAAGAYFYDWYPASLPRGERLAADECYVRLVTSHATTPEEVDRFLAVAAG